MAEAGQEIVGRDGSRLRIEQLEPGVLVMEASYPGTGSRPPVHLHPRQEERFEVLEGSLRVQVDGEERVYSAGEGFTVPPATPHTMGCDEPTRFRWETRPALRTAEFFERLHAGDVDLAEFADEIRFAGA